MHARILTYIDEVARQGTIRAAAENLNVAASAISRQIKAVEDELGTPLFHRAPRSLTLTAAGEMMVLHIRQTLKDMTRTRALIEDLKGLRRGEVTVALMSGLAASLVPRVIMQFRAANPNVIVRLRLMTNDDEMIAAVASGEVDLAIGFDFSAHNNVRTLATAIAPLGAVVAKGHPLAEQASVRLVDCFDYTLVLADQNTVIRPHLDQIFTQIGLHTDNLIETNSIEIMRNVTLRGDCVTFLTAYDIEAEIASGLLSFVPVQELSRETQSLLLVGPDRNATALGSVLAEHFKAALV